MNSGTKEITLQLISAKKLSEITGIPIRTLYRLAQDGSLPAVRFGKRIIRFDMSAVSRIVEGQLKSHE